MKKRWMSVLLLVVMLLSLFPTTAQAEDDRTYVKAIDLNIHAEESMEEILEVLKPYLV